jgi:hypothetical protein
MTRPTCPACDYRYPQDLCERCQSDQRLASWNTGFIAGMSLARERIEDAIGRALENLGHEIEARRAAYAVAAATTSTGVEAGARALCIVVGLDPDNTHPDRFGGDPIPLWHHRRAEAEACILAAAARPARPDQDVVAEFLGKLDEEGAGS